MSNQTPITADYHMHTPLCGHAQGSPSEFIATAEKRGLTEICFTDHVPAPDGYDPTNRMPLESFPDYVSMIRHAPRSPHVRVLLGIEADYYEPNDGFLHQWLPNQEFDFVLGSVHYVAEWGIDDPAQLDRWKTADVEKAWKQYFSLIKKLAESSLFDAVGHLDLPKKFGFRPHEELIPSIVQPALESMAVTGLGMELNTAGLRRPAREIYPSLQILQMARKLEIPICFGSDAHTPEDVGFAFDQARSLAIQAGYTHRMEFRKRRKKMVPL